MNTAINKRYDGLDKDGHHVTGLILHVAHYVKGTCQALDYLVVADRNGSGRPGQALVPAALVAAHLDGLTLCKSMEHDGE